MLVEDGRHGRDIFMAETQVRARESGVAGLYSLNTYMVRAAQHVAGEDLLGDSHRPWLGLNRRQKHFTLQSRYVKWKQASVLDDLAGDFVFTGRKLSQFNLF